jgi:hypothetical protein
VGSGGKFLFAVCGDWHRVFMAPKITDDAAARRAPMFSMAHWREQSATASGSSIYWISSIFGNQILDEWASAKCPLLCAPSARGRGVPSPRSRGEGISQILRGLGRSGFHGRAEPHAPWDCRVSHCAPWQPAVHSSATINGTRFS